ncbi:MAG: uridine kinase [Oscillospiraceae bacterium]|nr:uridine kinase [Oscillospiraceae bacterium]
MASMTENPYGNEYAGLFSRLKSFLPQGPLLVAIDGGSASGKTTLAAYLSERFDGTVFHMDDFFLRTEQRTPARYAEPGGNVDRERFLDEVLLPLKNREAVSLRKLDHTNGVFRLLPPVTIIPKPFVIVEGAYSMHPDLADFYDFSVFLRIPHDLQTRRVLARNGPEVAQMFFSRWIPLEQAYFDALHPAERCDLVIDVLE